MSRYTKRVDEDTLISYGYDPGGRPGYFYSVEKMGKTEHGEQIAEIVEAGDTRPEMIISENEKQMNRSEIAEKLKEYGVRGDHVEAMVMDQPF